MYGYVCHEHVSVCCCDLLTLCLVLSVCTSCCCCVLCCVVSVPRLYNRLYDKISSTIDASGGIKKWLFQKAFASKQYHLQNSGTLDGGIWDKLVVSIVTHTIASC